MVVEVFRPHGNFQNGIIRKFYDIDQNSIFVDVQKVFQDIPERIFPKAPFINDATYYQNIGIKGTYGFKLPKTVFLTSFALRPHVVNDTEWHYPKNWSFIGCNNENSSEEHCKTLYVDETSNVFASTRMKLISIMPGSYSSVRFSVNGRGAGSGSHWTIERIELFGFICDTPNECSTRNLFRCTVKYHRKLPLSFTIINLIFS